MLVEERYFKARRGVVLASGVLLLSIFVGISQEKAGSSGVLPFHLSNPKAIPHALAILSLYTIYNVVVSWAQYIAEDAPVRIRALDFYAVVVIGALAVSAYCIKSLGVLGFVGSLFVDVPANLDVNFGIIGGFSLVFLTALGSVLVARKYARVISVSVTKDRGAIEDKLRILLKAQDWVLDFNPKATGAKKKIGFRDDGRIGLGRNENERSWSINEGFLEIYKADGSLQNRFILRGNVWYSTNEPEADAIRRGINDQKIFAVTDYDEI